MRRRRRGETSAAAKKTNVASSTMVAPEAVLSQYESSSPPTALPTPMTTASAGSSKELEDVSDLRLHSTRVNRPHAGELVFLATNPSILLSLAIPDNPHS